MHPVGPLPASTYWRRRGVLLAALVVVLLLLKSCVGGGSPAKTSSTTPAPTPTVSRSASPRPTTTGTSPPVAAGGVCADGALKLVVTTDATTYPVGASPHFTLTVTNTSSAPCTRDLGSKAVSLRVISGTARTWDSDDCAPGNGTAPTRLAPGAPKQVAALTWSGTRSQPGCPTPRSPATAGTYQVSGTVGSLTSPRVVFHFR
jgi:hypothetical protein